MTVDWILACLVLVLVVVVARCGGWLANRMRQPRIAGELVAVMAIGPTVLGGQIEGVVDGARASGTVGTLFTPVAVDLLTWLGGLGLILYMLLVGMTIDPRPMAQRWRLIGLLVLALMAASVATGVGAALWLEADGGWRAPTASVLAFVLALSAAISAQGLPIAARILEERGLLRTEVGAAVIAGGACITALALVMSGVAIRGGGAGTAVKLIPIPIVGALLIAALAALLRSTRVRLHPQLLVIGLLVLAVAAGLVGQTLIGTVLLGPLVVGVVVSSGGAPAAYIDARLGRIVRGMLLPVFLGVAALHTDLREFGVGALLPVAALIACVVAAKLVAGYLAARAGGLDGASAAATSALLQCGGIMTIAVSLEQLHGGVITMRTHAALTLIGLVSTVIAGPLLARARLRAETRAGAASVAWRLGR